jgi:hypothetical protein
MLMKKTILFAALVLSTNLIGSNYYVTLDNKHYDDSIKIKETYNADGFNNAGIHKDTQTEYNSDGYNQAGFNIYGQTIPITCDTGNIGISISVVHAGSQYTSRFGTNWNTYHTGNIRTGSLESAINISLSNIYSRDGKGYQLRKTGTTSYITCQVS